jgi:hypothetical protein
VALAIIVPLSLLVPIVDVVLRNQNLDQNLDTFHQPKAETQQTQTQTLGHNMSLQQTKPEQKQNKNENSAGKNAHPI